MKIIYENNNIILNSCRNLDLGQTFECGQCFRFEKEEDGFFRGVADGRQLVLKQDRDTVTFFDVTEKEFNEKWKRYFDLDRDYAKIIEELSFDCRIKIACERTGGIHILKQDSWETLCSFIISQNNNIPRIKKIIASLCVLLGEPITKNIFSFPSAEKVAKAGIEGLGPIKSGFRAKYIFDAAQKVSSKVIDLDNLEKLDYAEAKKSLMSIKGVGEKVSDCVLLFGMGFYEAFPQDVWVKRVIEKYYGKDFSPDYFGKNAGIAQQYLFYYERNILKDLPCK